MGADWVRKSENRFRHQIQEQASKIHSSGMFILEEKMSVTYPCHWLDEKATCPLDTHLVIFQYAPHSRVSVMHQEVAVAEVRNEAAADLQRLFRSTRIASDDGSENRSVGSALRAFLRAGCR